MDLRPRGIGTGQGDGGCVGVQVKCKIGAVDADLHLVSNTDGTVTGESRIRIGGMQVPVLRRQENAVACARFAWGPQPGRIELVDPDDLIKELVRRRPVFQWTDSARTARSSEYAIQKIAPSGATHFPFQAD